jgi:WD40 repeat protein
MSYRRLFLALFSLLPVSTAAWGQAPGKKLPPQPLFQLQAGGPTAAVNSLAFGKSGEDLVLYAGGNDKVVHSWVFRDGAFKLGKHYRVPLGSGVQGAINALAVSGDGGLLAAAGKGVIRGEAGFFDPGIWVPRAGWMDEDMLQDEGTIFVFDTAADKVRSLRGHRGTVLALAFIPARKDKPPLLVSLAREPGPAAERFVGVLRLWDVSDAAAKKGAQLLATSPALHDPDAGRPGVVAWHTGPASKDVRVAVASHEQALRLWDPSNGRLEKVGQDGELQFNDGVAFLPAGDKAERGTLYTTGIPPQKRARLFAWKVDRDAPLAEAAPEAVLPAKSGSYGLALVASEPNGRPDHAAVLQYFVEDRRFQVLLESLGRGADEPFGTQNAAVPLWQQQERPTLAVAPDSRFLAVGSGRDPVLWVLRTSTVLANNPQGPALHSEGVKLARAAFVRDRKAKGRAPGVALEAKGWFVFDLTNRRLRPWSAQDWAEDEPQQDGSQVRVKDVGGRRVIEVLLAGGKTSLVRLDKDQELTAKPALLPRGPFPVPLLAVAYVEKGAPYLSLWDAASGTQVRQLTGHMGPVRAVAFDRSGKRLVSVADDKTARVWGLDDLGQTLGKHAAIRGLAVGLDRDTLRVVQRDDELLSDANREALAAVKEGDPVEGQLVVGARKKSFKTPQEFYEAVWDLRPASSWGKAPQRADRAVLRIAGRDVTLGVDQGADERKPLFSLFIPRTDDGAGRQWIGWSPAGPYDTGDVGQGERYIGWHFNPDKPGDPSRFATAAEYHKSLYRDGILAFLYQRGNLTDALKDWEKEATSLPQFSPYIAGIDPEAARDREGRPVVQTADLKLQTEVRGVHPARIHKVQWQVLRLGAGGPEALGPPQPFAGTQGPLEVDLPQTWKRGPYEVRVLVTLTNDLGNPHVASTALHYLPPKPGIEFDRDWLRDSFGGTLPRNPIDVMKQLFPLKASARPKASGPNAPPARLRLRLNGDLVKGVEGSAVNTDLALREGRNDVEVEAVNEGVKDDAELAPYETNTVPLVLYYTRDRRPPRISLLSVRSAEGKATSLVKDRPTEVDAPRVHILGRIVAEDRVTRATVAIGKGKPRDLGGFPWGSKVDFDEEIVLKDAGKVSVTFTAGTGPRAEDTQVAVLDYRPKLPGFALESPLVLEAGDPREEKLVGWLKGPDDLYPFEVREVLVNGKAARDVRRGGRGERRLTATAEFGPGNNRVEVVLANANNRATAVADVYRKRPPRGVSLKLLGEPKELTGDFAAVVEVPADRRLTRSILARTQVGGHDAEERVITPADWKVQESKGGTEVWTAVLRAVPLPEGKNTCELRVSNDDGTAASKPVGVVVRPPPVPPPQIVRVEQPPGTVREPRCRLSVRVRSAAGAPSVRVSRNDVDLARDLVGKPQAEDGDFIYSIGPLPLEEGTNRLAVLATNAGGSSEPVKVNVSYIPPAVELSFDGYEADGKDLPLRAPVPGGRVVLRGAVAWPADDDPALHQKLRLRVWVNDFEQDSVALGPPQGRVRRFAAPLILNRRENRVGLRFPEAVKLSEDQRLPGLTLLCDNPVQDQRLHLLVVAPEVRTRAELAALTDKVLQGLGARMDGAYTFRTPAFSRLSTYYAIRCWDQDAGSVNTFLNTIRNAIRRAPPDGFSDVVLVYFQGKTAVKDAKTYLRWTPTSSETELIDPDQMRAVLSDVLGAKLLLLDVAGREGSRHGPTFDRVGDLQYLWLGRDDDPKRDFLIDHVVQTLSRDGRWRTIRQQAEDAAKAHKDEVAVRSPKRPPGYDEILLRKKE